MYFLAVVLGAVAATAADPPNASNVMNLNEPYIPACRNLKADEIAVLETLQVKHDVQDQLVGEFVEVWGPETKQKTCAKTIYEKTDKDILDRERLTRALFVVNIENKKEKTFKNYAVKEVNGVYLVERCDYCV